MRAMAAKARAGQKAEGAAGRAELAAVKASPPAARRAAAEPRPPQDPRSEAGLNASRVDPGLVKTGPFWQVSGARRPWAPSPADRQGTTSGSGSRPSGPATRKECPFVSSLHPDMHDDETAANPLDLVEKLAVANDWPFHRQTDEELAAEIAGQWCYKLWFAWHPELGVMHVSCALDMKVPVKKRTPVYALPGDGEREAVARTFRSLVRRGPAGVPPCGPVPRRHRCQWGADRGPGRHCGLGVRALLSGVPVRDLGRQERPPRRSPPPCSRPRARPDAQRGPAALLVGGGRMGEALLAGWLAQGLYHRAVLVVEPTPGPARGPGSRPWRSRRLRRSASCWARPCRARWCWR